MKRRRRWPFAVLALALAGLFFARGRDDATVEAADGSLPTDVLRDIAGTDTGGIAWFTLTAAGWASAEQVAAARFSASGAGRSVEMETDTWKIHIEVAKINSIVCAYMPGMGGVGEIQATRFNQRVEFRGADGKALVTAHYESDRAQQFDALCAKHDLPGELDGPR